MNIGIVCNELPPGPVGGIGTFTTELVRGLTGLGHGVHLVSVDNQARSNSSETISSQLTIHRIAAKKGRLGGYLNRLKLFLLIHKLAVERQLDIVEVPDFEGWSAGWRKLPIPVVVRLHGSATYFADETHTTIQASIKFHERMAIQQADHILSVSRYTAHRTQNIFDLPLSPAIIYNGVTPPDRARVKTDYKSRDLVCYTGTLMQKKGVFALARAWPLVKSRRPNARLMMLGKDGGHGGRSSVEIIREFAGSCADSIDIVGHLPKQEMEALLTTADLAVYPSYSEAFALAPMEAMSLGVPTIYTSRASGRELMRNGIDGWLCDPDDIEGLAEHITHLLENEVVRRQLGEAGRRRIIEDFSYQSLLQQNLHFYLRCIAPPNTADLVVKSDLASHCASI
jgi:glycosyltransferase involved in cell wall biosynthesis